MEIGREVAISYTISTDVAAGQSARVSEPVAGEAGETHWYLPG